MVLAISRIPLTPFTMLTRLIYVSSASRPLSAHDLDEILAASQQHNAEADVTGALLHAGGTFMQVLEGPSESVAATYRRIETDPRHHVHTVLLRDPIGSRQFSTSPMEFYTIDQLSDDECHVARRLFDHALPHRERARFLLTTLARLAERDVTTKAA